MENKDRCVVCKETAFTDLYNNPYGYPLKRCNRCKLVQAVSMPSYAQINKTYADNADQFTPYLEQLPIHTEYLYRKAKEIRFRIYDLGFRNNTSKRFLNRKSYIVNRKLLDIGCAMGIVLKAAKEAGIQAEGVDVSKDAIDYCRSQGYIVHQGTLGTLLRRRTISRNAYDVVSGFMVIEHEHDPLGFATHAYSVLKKGGLLVLTTPNHDGMWRKITGKRWFEYTHPEHVVLFSPDTIRNLLKKAGFTDIIVKREPHRKYPMYTAFKRLADFSPKMIAPILLILMRVTKELKLINPINPWDDMIVWARK